MSWRITKSIELGLSFTSALTLRGILPIYLKWLIIYHHIRFAFSFMKSFIRLVVGISPFLKSKQDKHNEFKPKRYKTNAFKWNVPIFKIEHTLKLRNRNMFSSGRRVNFVGLCHFINALIDIGTQIQNSLDHEFATYSKIFCTCVDTASSNANLSRTQKELFLWHLKLRISM